MFKRNFVISTAIVLTAASVAAMAGRSGEYGEAAFSATLTLYAPIVVTKLEPVPFATNFKSMPGS